MGVIDQDLGNLKSDLQKSSTLIGKIA